MSAETLPVEPESPKWTEKTVLDAVEPRYRKPGNGGAGEYAFLRQVRNNAGFDASRTFDAVAVHLWPSRGFTVDVIEVKVSRSDWLRELRDPAKAEAAHRVGDRFIVAAPGGLVKPEELPPGWGLLEVSEKRTWMKVQPAPAKQKRAEFAAGFVIAMLRAAGAAAMETAAERDIREAVDAKAREMSQAFRDDLADERRRIEEGTAALVKFAETSRLRYAIERDPSGEARRVTRALNADRDRDALLSVLRNQQDRLSRMIADLNGEDA